MGSQVNYYIGIDLHKHFIQVCILDQEGKVIQEMKLPTVKEVIKDKLLPFKGISKTAVEATFNWYWLIDLLEELNLNPVLANPKKLRIITESKAKTDKIDAKSLASLLRLNFLPTSYIPPKPIRELKELIRTRSFLVSLRSSLKNRIHSLLDKKGIKHNFTDLFSPSGRLFLRNLSLEEPYKESLLTQLNAIEELEEKIKSLEKELFTFLKHPLIKKTIRLLISIPGISRISALILASEIFIINRFRNHKKLASYSGVVATVKQSSDKLHYGRINKDSNHYIRTTLIEAIPHLIRKDPFMYAYYQRILYKKGHNKAKIAVARKLITIIYYMLKENIPYPLIMEKLRSGPSRATGELSLATPLK